jgi:ABC-type dipeptide/oligopeptide/nickel transport system permease component
MLQETQYGRWVVAGVRGRMPGASHDWQLEPTLALIGTGIVGSYFLGPLLAAWTATAAAGRRAALAISLFLASVPAAAAADWLRLSGMTHRALALVAMLVLGAGMLCLYQYQATRDAFSHDFVQTHRAFGASRLRAALGALRSSSLVSAAHLANHGPGLFAAACVVEWAFDWHGLGWLALTAVHERDIATLTWIALFGTLLSGLLHIMSDLLQSRFERGHEARS